MHIRCGSVQNIGMMTAALCTTSTAHAADVSKHSRVVVWISQVSASLERIALNLPGRLVPYQLAFVTVRKC